MAQPNDDLVGMKLVSLGDTWADVCHCGNRAYFGAASCKGPEGCREAVESGRVFCDDHIPAVLTNISMAEYLADCTYETERLDDGRTQ